MMTILCALVGQDFGAQAGIDLGSSMMSVAAMNSAIGAGVHPIGGRTRPVPNTTFRADPIITARVKRQYLDFLARKVSPSASQDAAKFLGQVDFKQAWARAEGPDGLRPDNVADAAAAYFALNWCIANGKDSFTAASVQALRRQFGPVIFGQPAFRRLSNAQRQEMAEVWMINFVVQAGGYGGAKSNPAMLQKVQDAAVTRFKNEAHLDLRTLRLTDQGFVKA